MGLENLQTLGAPIYAKAAYSCPYRTEHHHAADRILLYLEERSVFEIKQLTLMACLWGAYVTYDTEAI